MNVMNLIRVKTNVDSKDKRFGDIQNKTIESIKSDSDPNDSKSDSSIESFEKHDCTRKFYGINREYAANQKMKSIQMFKKILKSYGIERGIGDQM